MFLVTHYLLLSLLLPPSPPPSCFPHFFLNYLDFPFPFIIFTASYPFFSLSHSFLFFILLFLHCLFLNHSIRSFIFSPRFHIFCAYSLTPLLYISLSASSLSSHAALSCFTFTNVTPFLASAWLHVCLPLVSSLLSPHLSYSLFLPSLYHFLASRLPLPRPPFTFLDLLLIRHCFSNTRLLSRSSLTIFLP